MKKLISLLLALLMLLGTAGCSDIGITEEDVVSTVVDAVLDELEDSEASEDSLASSESQESEAQSSSSVTIEVEIGDMGGFDQPTITDDDETQQILDEYADYYSKEDVALYIHTYGKLPVNFITKDEARDLGWEGGSVEVYGEGLAIGGDKFGNREGLLPKADGRQYYECDIDTFGKDSRGAKRIIYSNDGLIYYTDDHYESFTLLYGEE